MDTVGRQVGGKVWKGRVGVLLSEGNITVVISLALVLVGDQGHKKDEWKKIYIAKCKKLYLGSLDAARRGSRAEGFFPPSFSFSTFPTTLTLSFTTAFPFSASISPSSDGFAAGAGFSRMPRPDDGQESEFEE